MGVAGGVVPVLGSPAHAGIDLIVLSVLVVVGFPRTRGDRPAGWMPAICAFTVPPHTRG